MQASAYSVIAIHIGFGITELFRSNLFRKSGQFPHDAIIDVINTMMVLVVTQPTILHYGGPAVNYRGNFGNFLFFWNMLFGAAKITHTYPQSYGVANLPDATLGHQLLWPIFRENKDMESVVPGARPVS